MKRTLLVAPFLLAGCCALDPAPRYASLEAMGVPEPLAHAVSDLHSPDMQRRIAEARQ